MCFGKTVEEGPTKERRCQWGGRKTAVCEIPEARGWCWGGKGLHGQLLLLWWTGRELLFGNVGATGGLKKHQSLDLVARKAPLECTEKKMGSEEGSTANLCKFSEDLCKQGPWGADSDLIGL